jgi:outer membrane receptor protein involved in Fe transport
MLPLRKAQGLNKLVQFIAISACLIIPATGLSQESGADDVALEEIIVTARKRTQSLSNVPIAISAIGQSQIEDFGYTNLESWFRTMPSVSLVDGGAQRKQVVIRGIAIDHSVRADSLSSIYLDETLVSGNLFGLDLRIFDMERLEVLKGPQGTLFGGGSISGAVRYITNKPDTTEYQTNVALDVSKTDGADDPGWSVDAMVNVPLVEGVLGLRAVVYNADHAGYYHNDNLGLENQGQYDQTGGRLSLRWTPTETLSVTGTYFIDETDQDGWYRSSGDNWQDHNQANRMQELLTADAEIISLNVEWDVGWAAITSATAQYDFEALRKVDRTFLGIDQFLDSARLAVLDDEDEEVFSQELRIVSAPDTFGKFDWIAGLYYSDRDTNQRVGDYIGLGDGYDQNNAGQLFADAAPTQDFVFPFPVGYVSPFGPTQQGCLPGTCSTDTVDPGTFPDMIYREIGHRTQEQLAFFGEVSYSFNDSWTGTFGYRRTETDTSGSFVNQVADAGEPVFSENVVTPLYEEPHDNYMFNVAYQMNDNMLFFARAAEGFRVGTGGAGPTIQPSCQALAEQVFGFVPGKITSDTMWGYDLGAKMTLADGRLSLNAGFFRNEWTDIQVQVRLEGNATCSIRVTQNVAAATGDGFEIDATWAATDQLLLTLAGSWVDFTLDDDQEFLNALSGDRLPSHPDLNLSASATYDFPFSDNWDGFVRGELSYVGEILGDFNADAGVPRGSFGEYTIVNLRFGASTEKWNVALYFDNLFNEDALTFQFKDRRDRTESLVARPFTVGVNVRTRF